MQNITVAEILRMHGKWIKSTEFVNLVSEKLRISERMAYKKIKEAAEKGEIEKLPLPNRTVLYGLAEFGPSNTEDIISTENVDFEFYIKHGLLTKEEIDVYTVAKTLLPIVPKDLVPYVKLIIIRFREKLKILSELSGEL